MLRALYVAALKRERFLDNRRAVAQSAREWLVSILSRTESAAYLILA